MEQDDFSDYFIEGYPTPECPPLTDEMVANAERLLGHDQKVVDAMSR